MVCEFIVLLGDAVVIGASTIQALRDDDYDEFLTRSHRVSVDTSMSSEEPTVQVVMEQVRLR